MKLRDEIPVSRTGMTGEGYSNDKKGATRITGEGGTRMIGKGYLDDKKRALE
jgi:hypothetical protein